MKPITRRSSANALVPTIGGKGEWAATLFSRLEGDILPRFLPRCRWFGGKGHILRSVRVLHVLPIGSLEDTRMLVIEVARSSAEIDRYVLPLIITDKPFAEPSSVLARFAGGGFLCDAVYSAEARAELLRFTVQENHARVRPRLAGNSPAVFDDRTFRHALANSRVVGADQSNTSLVFGEKWFFKLFRKYERGRNPDQELTQFLSEECGFRHIPRYLGALKLMERDAEGVIGLLVGFTPNRGDAWSFSLAALERFFDRVLGTKRRLTPSTLTTLIGRAYPSRAGQLGRRTAEMHLALASGGSRPAFSAEPYSIPYQRSISEGMCESAKQVLGQLRRQIPRLPAAIREEAAEVAAGEKAIARHLRRLLEKKIAATRIRIHGDFHLGQVLDTGRDFAILDFEGEPRRTLAERLAKRSALVDVAGMIRSFDYAAAVALRQRRGSDAARLEPWARAWVARVTQRFLDSYFASAAGASFLPPAADDVRLLLDLFILEKAIYEIGYELSYRPDFLPIPLRAVRELLRAMT